MLANDSDPDGDPIHMGGVTQPSHGTVDFGPNNSSIYKPAPNFNGNDEFTYRVDDWIGWRSQAVKVTVHVRPVNDAPITHVPATQHGNKVTFTGPTHIWVDDVDAGNARLKVRLTVDYGRLTIPDRNLLTFPEGDGERDKAMTFLATLNEIFFRLDRLQYSGPTGVVAHLTWVTDDQGNNGAGGPLTDTDVITIEP
jgi:hypothetical protein